MVGQGGGGRPGTKRRASREALQLRPLRTLLDVELDEGVHGALGHADAGHNLLQVLPAAW